MGLTRAHTHTQTPRVTGWGIKPSVWRRNGDGGTGAGALTLDRLAWGTSKEATFTPGR